MFLFCGSCNQYQSSTLEHAKCVYEKYEHGSWDESHAWLQHPSKADLIIAIVECNTYQQQKLVTWTRSDYIRFLMLWQRQCFLCLGINIHFGNGFPFTAHGALASITIHGIIVCSSLVISRYTSDHVILLQEKSDEEMVSHLWDS